MEKKVARQINAFDMAQEQFDSAAKLLNLDPGIAEVLRWPAQEYSFRIPVRMDDGSLRVFSVWSTTMISCGVTVCCRS